MARMRETLNATFPCPPSPPPESYHEYRQAHVRCEVTSSSAIPLALHLLSDLSNATSASQYGTGGLIMFGYSLTPVGHLNLNLSVAKE